MFSEEQKKLTSWSSIPTGGGFISAHALTKLVITVGGIAETQNLQEFTTIIYRYQHITNLPTSTLNKHNNRQSACYVTMRCIHATTVAMDNKYYILWVSTCSLRSLACNAQVPYCHRWPVQLYNIFPYFLINGIIRKKKKKKKKTYWNKNVHFDFLYNFAHNIRHSTKKWVIYHKKMYIGLHIMYWSFLSEFN
jgi:hypothetical protein